MATQVGLDRAAVIEAAGELADEHGYRSVTLAMLATKLGVRSQSLYAHVDGIDGLRRDLGLRGQELLADDLRTAAMAQSGRNALFAIASAFDRFASAHPGLYEASLQAPGEDEDIIRANARTMEPLLAVLRSYGFTDEEITHEYRAIWSAIHGFLDLRNGGLLTWPVDTDESFRRLIEVFARDLERHADERA